MTSEVSVERPVTLDLSEPEHERHVRFSSIDEGVLQPSTRRNKVNNIQSPKKVRTELDFRSKHSEKEFRSKRKRSYSCSGSNEVRCGSKYRKHHYVTPCKFLLGGNINDPLNLRSIDRKEPRRFSDDSEVNQASKVSEGFQRSQSVRVIIPKKINDPLNLDASSDDEDILIYERQPKRKRRKRKRRLSEPGTLDHSLLDGENMFKMAVCENVVDVINPDLVKDSVANSTHQKSILQESLNPPTTVALSPDTSNPQTTTTHAPDTVVVIETVIHSSSFQTTTEQQRSLITNLAGINSSEKDLLTSDALSQNQCLSHQQLKNFIKKQRAKVDNKIVSPVLPQSSVERKRNPTAERKRHLNCNPPSADKPHFSQQNLAPPIRYNPKGEMFMYGNYNKYYGYRNPGHTSDPRLSYLKPDWFDGKDVLDIGCNIGHVTLTVARDYNPKKVVGIDIDKKLVNIAEKNIKHYMRQGGREESEYPKSMRMLYGPLKPPLQSDGTKTFPYNVKFIHANYVLESDELLETVRPEFDIILCLSISKWVHLNWGDEGLKRFFKRIHRNLRPGGKLILESQGWPSYSKKRKLTERIFENYKKIRLFPEQFTNFLLHDVGFSTCEKLVTPPHVSKGFQRPIQVYTKVDHESQRTIAASKVISNICEQYKNKLNEFADSAVQRKSDMVFSSSASVIKLAKSQNHPTVQLSVSKENFVTEIISDKERNSCNEKSHLKENIGACGSKANCDIAVTLQLPKVISSCGSSSLTLDLQHNIHIPHDSMPCESDVNIICKAIVIDNANLIRDKSKTLVCKSSNSLDANASKVVKVISSVISDVETSEIHNAQELNDTNLNVGWKSDQLEPHKEENKINVSPVVQQRTNDQETCAPKAEI